MVDLTVDGQRPSGSIDFFRGDAIVTDEVTVGRRDFVVEQVWRAFRIHGAVVEDRKAVFARNGKRLLGQGCWNEPRRHVAVERYESIEQGRHGGKSCSFQESAAIFVRYTAEDDAVGFIGGLNVEIKQVNFFFVQGHLEK